MYVQGSEKFRKSMNSVFEEPKTLKIIKEIVPARLNGKNDEKIRFYRDFIEGQIRQGNVEVNKSKVKTIRKKKYGGMGIRYFGFYIKLKNPAIFTN